MKRFALALLLTLISVPAWAQCNGVFPNNTVCGNITGSGNLPRPTNPSTFLGAAGGLNGQIQYNNAGALGGVTAPSQDCTISVPGGVVNCTRLQNIPVTTTGANSNDVLSFNGTGWVPRAVNAACSLTPLTCYTIYGSLSPYWYGALCDGTTNDTAAFASLMTAAAGRNVQLPAATCVINAHLTVPANTVIAGVSRELSIIKQIGADYIFNITNVSNVTIRDLYLLGNRAYTSWTASNVGGIFASYNTTQSNLTFRNLKFSNFNATYWIQFSQTANNLAQVMFDNIWMLSTAADVPTDPDPFANATHGMAMFSGTLGSRYDNVTIKNWQVDGSGLCIGVILYSNYFKYTVRDSRFLNMGGVNTNSFCTNALAATNVYGVAVYDLNADGNPPQDGLIVNNYVTHPLATGIYVVGDPVNYGLLIEGNLVTGQVNTDGLAVRAGITVTSAAGVSVVGNTLINNARGITVSSQTNGVVSVLSNHIVSGAGASNCLQLTSGPGAANTDRKVVRGNYFECQGVNVQQTSTTGNRLGVVDVSGNSSTGIATNMDFGGAFFAGGLVLANNFITGGSTNLSGITGGLTLSNNAGLSFTAATLPTANNGSSVFVSDGTPATACTGAGTGSQGFRQNGAWKCF